MEIIALQEYTDKYVSLYQGEIRNINTELAERLIEKDIVKQHNQNDQESSDNKAFRIKVTVAGTFPNITSATADKTFQEVLSAYNANKPIVAEVNINGGSVPILTATPVAYTDYMNGAFSWNVIANLGTTALIVTFSYSKNNLFMTKSSFTVSQ